MSTVIIINPPPKKPEANRTVDPKEQLLKDLKVLEDAGYKVQVYHTEK